jgi:hypothetical protein
MKRLIWGNLLLGSWLLISPFVLRLFYPGAFRVTWEDFIFGFWIAAFSLARLWSRLNREIILADWVVTTIGLLTLLNPLLYNYYGIRWASWNNLVVGATIVALAAFLDWKDSHPSI